MKIKEEFFEREGISPSTMVMKIACEKLFGWGIPLYHINIHRIIK
jgi:hypothetical protein